MHFAPTSFSSPLFRIKPPVLPPPPPPPPEILSFTGVPRPRVIAEASTSRITVNDRVIDRTIGATTVTDYDLDLRVFAAQTPPTVATLTPSVATVEGVSRAVWQSNGTATLRATAGPATRDLSLVFSSATAQTTDAFVSHVPGSLAAHVAQTVDSRLAGKSAETAKSIFTTRNHQAGVYVRNPNVWCADLPNLLTPLSPWNSGGYGQAATLISPRHVIMAAHFEVGGTNATIRFVKMDGTVVARTLIDRRRHPSYSNYYPDLTVGVLNADVPEDIAFCRVLPDNWTSYLPSVQALLDSQVPLLTLDQEAKALVTDWKKEDTTSIVCEQPTNAKRLEFYEPKIFGDSSQPAILPVNGLPVILTCWTSGGPGSGTSIRLHKQWVNTAMTQLGGGYQLTDIDLSGFPTF